MCKVFGTKILYKISTSGGVMFSMELTGRCLAAFLLVA